MSCPVCLERLRDDPDGADAEDDGTSAAAAAASPTHTLSACDCGHVFHTSCIESWMAHLQNQGASRSCPTCKAKQTKPPHRLFLELGRGALGFASAADADATIRALEADITSADARASAAEERAGELDEALAAERSSAAGAAAKLRAEQVASRVQHRALAEMKTALAEAQREVAALKERGATSEYVRQVLEPPAERREGGSGSGTALPLMGLRRSYQQIKVVLCASFDCR